MDLNGVKKELNEFQHLTVDQIQQLLDLYNEIGLFEFEPYPGGLEFARSFKRASLLQTDGVLFTTSSSTSNPTIVINPEIY